MKPVISVLGAGLMGSALVRRFVNQGYQTYVWNRTRSRADALAAEGAKAAESVLQAAETSDVVVVNVTNYATAKQLLQTSETEDRLRGKTVVQLSTGTPKQSREMARWAEEKQIRYLDGAIMVTPDLIGTPECTVLYSGPGDLFEDLKPLLEALGGTALHVGSDYGFASTLDSSLLSVYWGFNFAVHHAIALCQAEQFPLDVLSQSLVRMNPFFAKAAADAVGRVETQNFKADLATLAICHQSVRLLIEQSKDVAVQHGFLDSFDRIFQQAVDAGHNDDDMSVINAYMKTVSTAAAGDRR